MSTRKTRVNIDMIDPEILSKATIESVYAPLNSAVLTGIPKAPTAESTTNTDQISTTKFVKTAISNLSNSVSTALDTKLNITSANYIKSLSISGKTITYTKGNDTTGTLTTQDTVTTINSTVSGSGNAITSLSANNGVISITKGSTFSLSDHTHSYLPLSGGTLTGAVTFANNTWNLIGDDCKLGDVNVAGCIGLIGNNANTGIVLCKYGAQSTQAKITYDGTKVYCNTTFEATKLVGAYYADYAEWFPRGEDTEPGDIIVLDLDSDKEQYIKSSQVNTKVVGVHSDNYSHIIGGDLVSEEENLKNYIPVALCGRIATKVIGVVHKGDYIVPSVLSGVGRVYIENEDDPKTIIGMLVEEDDLNYNIRRLKVKLK